MSLGAGFGWDGSELAGGLYSLVRTGLVVEELAVSSRDISFINPE